MSRPATTRMKVSPPVGSLPVLQYCSPEQLQIDEAYQRSLETAQSQTLIRRIAMFWDWGLCQPLVVARRADGGLYVVDGQHRLAGAKLRGDIWQLPCVIASYRSAAEEAAAFVAINQERRPLGALQIFKAAVAAEDPAAVAVMAAIAQAGLSLASSTNLNEARPGALSNVGGLRQCLESQGGKVLRVSLVVLAKSYPGQSMRYAGSIFPGIADIVAAELKSPRSEPTADLLIEMIGAASQAEWFKEILAAVAVDPNLNRRRASIQVFKAAWAECIDAALDEAA